MKTLKTTLRSTRLNPTKSTLKSKIDGYYNYEWKTTTTRQNQHLRHNYINTTRNLDYEHDQNRNCDYNSTSTGIKKNRNQNTILELEPHRAETTTPKVVNTTLELEINRHSSTERLHSCRTHEKCIRKLRHSETCPGPLHIFGNFSTTTKRRWSTTTFFESLGQLQRKNSKTGTYNDEIWKVAKIFT